MLGRRRRVGQRSGRRWNLLKFSIHGGIIVHMNAVATDPEIMHGTPCFTGTRVPVKSLFDHLERGYNVEYFLYQFPTMEREQVMAVLQESLRHAEARAEHSGSQ